MQVGSPFDPSSTVANPIVQGCEHCHEIAGHEGHCGPTLAHVTDRLSSEQITIRIVSGGTNISALDGTLTLSELQNLVTSLDSRSRIKKKQ